MISGGKVELDQIKKIAVEQYSIPEDQLNKIVDTYVKQTQIVCDQYYGDPKHPMPENKLGVAGARGQDPKKQSTCEGLFLDGKLRSQDDFLAFSGEGDISVLTKDFKEGKRFLRTLYKGNFVSYPSGWFKLMQGEAKAQKKEAKAQEAGFQAKGTVSLEPNPSVWGNGTGFIGHGDGKIDLDPTNPKLRYGVGGSINYSKNSPFAEKSKYDVGGTIAISNVAREGDIDFVSVDSSLYGFAKWAIDGAHPDTVNAIDVAINNEQVAKTETAIKERFGKDIAALYLPVLQSQMRKSTDFTATWDVAVTQGVALVKKLLSEKPLEDKDAAFCSELFQDDVEPFVLLLGIRVGKKSREEMETFLKEKGVGIDDLEGQDDVKRLEQIKKAFAAVNGMPVMDLKQNGFDPSKPDADLLTIKTESEAFKKILPSFTIDTAKLKEAGEKLVKARGMTTLEQLKKEATDKGIRYPFDPENLPKNPWAAQDAIEKYKEEIVESQKAKWILSAQLGQVDREYLYSGTGAKLQLDYSLASVWIYIGSGAGGLTEPTHFAIAEDGFAFGGGLNLNGSHKFKGWEKRLSEISGKLGGYYSQAGSDAHAGANDHIGWSATVSAKLFGDNPLDNKDHRKPLLEPRIVYTGRRDSPNNGAPIGMRHFLDLGTLLNFEPLVDNETLKKMSIDFQYSRLRGDRGASEKTLCTADDNGLNTNGDGTGAGAFCNAARQDLHGFRLSGVWQPNENFTLQLGVNSIILDSVVSGTTTSFTKDLRVFAGVVFSN